MKNYVQDDESCDYTAGGALLSGDVVTIGPMLAVLHDDLANGETGTAFLEGIFDLPKNTSTVMALGSTPYWDISAGEFAAGTPATGDIQDAVVVLKAAASTDATVRVVINVGAGTVT